MGSMLEEFGKIWLVWRGRGKSTPRYIFQDTEIVSPPYPKKVSSLWNATYLNLHPTHFAVAIAPGGKICNLRGGYIHPLSPGMYNIHYVDKQNRVNHLPRTSETTSDGFQVAIELIISYRVIDPVMALEVQNPVDTLLRLLQANLKEFIRSHKYEEIMGDLDGHKIDNELVVGYIKEQHFRRSPLSKLFYVLDVMVQEKIGDPKVTEIREKYQISQKQLDNQKVLQALNQELEKKVADQDALIKKIKAESSVTQQDIIQKMELQKIDLEKARADFQYRQENWKVAVDAIVQTLSNQTYPPDTEEYALIKELLSELRVSTTLGSEAGRSAGGPGKTYDPKRIQELAKKLTNWRKPAPPP